MKQSDILQNRRVRVDAVVGQPFRNMTFHALHVHARANLKHLVVPTSITNHRTKKAFSSDKERRRSKKVSIKAGMAAEPHLFSGHHGASPTSS